jgi:hypothetical protein
MSWGGGQAWSVTARENGRPVSRETASNIQITDSGAMVPSNAGAFIDATLATARPPLADIWFQHIPDLRIRIVGRSA